MPADRIDVGRSRARRGVGFFPIVAVCPRGIRCFGNFGVSSDSPALCGDLTHDSGRAVFLFSGITVGSCGHRDRV